MFAAVCRSMEKMEKKRFLDLQYISYRDEFNSLSISPEFLMDQNIFLPLP